MSKNKSALKRNFIIAIISLVGLLIVLIVLFNIALTFKSDDSQAPSGCSSCVSVNSKAEEYYNKGYYDLAEEEIRKDLKKDDKNPQKILLLASILLKQEKEEDALKEYTKYLEIKPGDVDILINVSTLYDVRKEFDKAEKYLLLAIKYAPKNDTAHNNLCWVLSEKKEYEKAIEYCKIALEISPGKPFILDSMAYTLEGMGKHDEALDYYNEAISIDPTEPEYYRHIADVYLQKGQKEEAIKNLNEFLDLAPESKYAAEVKEKIKSLQ